MAPSCITFNIKRAGVYSDFGSAANDASFVAWSCLEMKLVSMNMFELSLSYLDVRRTNLGSNKT